MNGIAFEIAKDLWRPEDKFNANQVKEMLENYNLELDFSAAELLNVWKK